MASPKSKTEPVYTDCVVVGEPVREGETASRIISRACTKRGEASTQVAPRAPSYAIIVLFQHANYRGSTLTMRGVMPCGTYLFHNTRPSDNGAGSWGASSWQTFNGCDRTILYYGYEFRSPSAVYAAITRMPTIPSNLNDHVWSVMTER